MLSVCLCIVFQFETTWPTFQKHDSNIAILSILYQNNNMKDARKCDVGGPLSLIKPPGMIR